MKVSSFRDVVQAIETELSELVDIKKEEIIGKLKLSYKNRETVYICEDNGKLYFTKPRRCRNYEQLSVNEYIKREIRNSLKARFTRLEGWRWLCENCDGLLEISNFYIGSKMLFFKGGYMYVMGIDRPVIIVSLSGIESVKKQLSFLKCLKKSPYEVNVYIGLKSYSVQDAIKLVKNNA